MLSGHPKGLFRLFFIEMWERLAFYTMVGILLLYTIDTAEGGLGLSKVVGNEIYGLYLAFVYFTPYIGGLLADRFLGYRRAVFIGGMFFILGFFLMGIYGSLYFTTGLVCLCIGNGFFKPNISVMVGNLYEKGDSKRDTGFSIFYMGINIGAFLANFVAVWVKKDLGWLWIFWTAGIGMSIGMVILLASWGVLAKADRQPEQSPDDVSLGKIFGVIIAPALAAGALGYFVWSADFIPDDWRTLVRPAIVGFLLGMVPIVIFFVRLGTTANAEEKPGLLSLLPVYVAGATFFMVLHLNGSAMTTWAKENTDRTFWVPFAGMQEDGQPEYYANAGPEDPRPSKKTLVIAPSAEIANMFGQKRIDQSSLDQILVANPGVTAERVREDWSAEDSKAATAAQHAEWSKRGADIYGSVTVEKTTDAHGHESITVSPGKDADGEDAKKQHRVALIRKVGETVFACVVVTQEIFDTIYSGYEERFGKAPSELPPGELLPTVGPALFQSLNALFVVGFTPFLIMFFTLMMNRKKTVTTAQKIFYGMLLTTFSLVLMGFAGMATGDGLDKGTGLWLVGFYAILSIGELCLSPMALSLVTKLSPKRFVGLTMGGWFLATAFGNNFSGFFGGLESQMDPTPFFFLLAGITGVVTLFILVLLPKLNEAMKKYGA